MLKLTPMRSRGTGGTGGLGGKRARRRRGAPGRNPSREESLDGDQERRNSLSGGDVKMAYRLLAGRHRRSFEDDSENLKELI